MAATLGRSGIQPPREGCFYPVIAVDILDQRIEEKSGLQVRRDRKAPNGHSVNLDDAFSTLTTKNSGSEPAREGGLTSNERVG